MRLLATIGYQKVLFAKGIDYSALIDALSSSQIVEETGPYSNRILTVKASGSEVEIKLINDDDIQLPSTDRPEAIQELLKIAKERDDLNAKVYKLEFELKKIRETVKEVA
jgi:hypothetical protein